MKTKMLFLLLIFLLTSCGTDPRDAADAYATTSQADQTAADAELTRTITAEEQAQKMAEAKATEAERVAAKNRVIRYASIFGTICLIACMIGTAYVYYKYLAPGLANAAILAADIKARCIPLDPKTRTYPAVIHYLSNGRATISLPGQSAVLLLDKPHEPNEQQIAVQGQTQAIGLLADAAKGSKQESQLGLLPMPDVINAMDIKNLTDNIRTYSLKKGQTS
jgi:hypothetical protein